MTEAKSLKKITSSLEDHTDDLKKINDFVTKTRQKFDDDVHKQRLSSLKRERYIESVEEALGLVGDMSVPVFNILTPLEEFYSKQHKKSPKLGRKLFAKKYSELHDPYDKVKNKLWKLLFTVKGVKDMD